MVNFLKTLTRARARAPRAAHTCRARLTRARARAPPIVPNFATRAFFADFKILPLTQRSELFRIPGISILSMQMSLNRAALQTHLHTRI